MRLFFQFGEIYVQQLTPGSSTVQPHFHIILPPAALPMACSMCSHCSVLPIFADVLLLLLLQLVLLLGMMPMLVLLLLQVVILLMGSISLNEWEEVAVDAAASVHWLM
jgi:hypothetical protein